MIDLKTIDQLIRTSEPQRRWRRGSTIALLGLSMLLGAILASPSWKEGHVLLGWIVPHALLLTIVGLVAYDVWRQKKIGRLLNAAQEAVQWRDWERAGDLLRQMLSHPNRVPSMRARGLMALAAVAEGEQQYEAVCRVCDYLRREVSGRPVLRHMVEVSMAAALLRTGQTTDAVAMIDRLRGVDLPDSLRAHVELLALLREVSLGHAHEQLEQVEKRRELFRTHLGTQAAYGYGLLAAAFDRAGMPEEAAKQWHDATLLMRVEELVRRVPELAPIAARHPAVEHPI